MGCNKTFMQPYFPNSESHIHLSAVFYSKEDLEAVHLSAGHLCGALISTWIVQNRALMIRSSQIAFISFSLTTTSSSS